MIIRDFILLNKADAIYASCETRDHWASAERWMWLARRAANASWVKDQLEQMARRCNIKQIARPIIATGHRLEGLEQYIVKWEDFDPNEVPEEWRNKDV